jgi:outer membrane immunogenic protein
LRGEYLFYAFDGLGATVSKVVSTGPCPSCQATYTWGDIAIHTVRLGLNYKWDGVAVAEAPTRPTPAKDWTGFYAGFHGGWTFARSDAVSTTARDPAGGAFLTPGAFGLDDNAPLIGGQFGYNWQTGNWVLGVEADLSGAGIHGVQSRTPICSQGVCGLAGVPIFGAGNFMRQDVNWLASVRGRIGQAWGSGLIYVTGGFAWANVDHEANTSGMVVCFNSPGCAFPAAFSRTRTGWTVGGGYEWPVWSNWTLRSEYLFSRFDGVSATVAPAPAPTSNCLTAGPCSATYRWNDLDIHTLRVALNYAW